MKNMKRKELGAFGFTLVEILVTIIIITTVLLVAVPQFRSSQRENDNRQAQAVLMELAEAVKAFRSSSPDRANLGDFAVTRALAESQSCGIGGTMQEELFGCGYMRRIPLDGRNMYKGYSFRVCGSKSTGTVTNGDLSYRCLYDSIASMRGTTVPTGRFQNKHMWVNPDGSLDWDFLLTTPI